MNVILDAGMVLVDFCWRDLLKKLGITGEDFEAVADASVRSSVWNEFDRSVMTDEEILAAFKRSAPAHEAQMQLFWDHMSEVVVQYPYAKTWIMSLKDAGCPVYILSNYSRRLYELTSKTALDFLPLADGAVFSFQTGYTKPEKEIYHYIMEAYHLHAEECVFIDDSAANLVYPKQIGWHTIQFQTFAQVQAELKVLQRQFTKKTQIGRE